MSSRVDDNSLSLDINILDTQYMNGVPKGSVVAVIGGPQTSAGDFVAQMCSVRKTDYISTAKPDNIVEEVARATSARVKEERETPENMSVYEVFNIDENSYNTMTQVLEEMEEQQHLVVDTFTQLINLVEEEDGVSAYDFTREIMDQVDKTESVAYLHFPKMGYNRLDEKESNLISLVDGIFLFDEEPVGNEINMKLKIPRMRGIENMEQNVFSLENTQRISIDSSTGLA